MRALPQVVLLEAGTHEAQGNYVYIRGGYPVAIIGAGEQETIVQGFGFDIRGGDWADKKSTTKSVVLCGMTLRQAKCSGVVNDGGIPVRLIDFTVHASGGDGVRVSDGARAICTNLTVSDCQGCGAYARGGQITLERVSLTGNARQTRGRNVSLVQRNPHTGQCMRDRLLLY